MYTEEAHRGHEAAGARLLREADSGRAVLSLHREVSDHPAPQLGLGTLSKVSTREHRTVKEGLTLSSLPLLQKQLTKWEKSEVCSQACRFFILANVSGDCVCV